MSPVDEGGDEPETIALRDAFLPTGDQGRRGTCVAFAVTSIHEMDRSAGDGLPDDLAEEVLFWGAKQVDGDTRDGTRFSSADQALRRWGQPAEALWPYNDDRDHRAVDYQPPPPAIEAANCHTTALRSLPITRISIETELAAGRPVVLGTPVWDAFRSASTQPVPPPTEAELYPTRHAVVIAGFDRASGALLVRNSWGPKWGNNGYAWVDVGLVAFATGAWAIDAQAAAPTGIDNDTVLQREAT